MNKRLQADYLLVEGWISESSLEQAAKEFSYNKYKKVLVTGIPIENWYFLPENGIIKYNLGEDSLLLRRGDSIKINLKGTQAKGSYAHFNLFINDKKAGDGYTTEEWEEHLYITDSLIFLRNLSIEFDNDDFYGKEDRNIFIRSVNIMGSEYPARSVKTVLYYEWDTNRTSPVSTNFKSVAGIAASRLELAGVPREKIVVLPAESSGKNRTLKSAIAVDDWIIKNSLAEPTINIFTENIHSRRSWLVYRSILKEENVRVGILTANNDNDNLENIKINNSTILRELTGILYYSIYGIFN